MIRVRVAQADDLSEIDLLLHRTYPILLKKVYPPSLLVTAMPLISKAQPNLIQSGTYFVAERDGGIVGAGGWTHGRPGDSKVGKASLGYVRHVVADHKSPRQGIGRQIMARVLETARAAGVTQLECYSTLLAVAFYAKLGFDEIGPMTIPLAPGVDFPAVHMRQYLIG